MKRFEERELREARDHAATGGQALHVMGNWVAQQQARTPGCFRRSREVAHLFDQDAERLTKTARRLGVRVILVERPGTPSQHIDLCGQPLSRALKECGADTQPELPIL